VLEHAYRALLADKVQDLVRQTGQAQGCVFEVAANQTTAAKPGGQHRLNQQAAGSTPGCVALRRRRAVG
jgi:hypothetical protein